MSEWEAYTAERPNGTIIQFRVKPYGHDANTLDQVDAEVLTRERASDLFARLGRALQ